MEQHTLCAWGPVRSGAGHRSGKRNSFIIFFFPLKFWRLKTNGKQNQKLSEAAPGPALGKGLMRVGENCSEAELFRVSSAPPPPARFAIGSRSAPGPAPQSRASPRASRSSASPGSPRYPFCLGESFLFMSLLIVNIALLLLLFISALIYRSSYFPFHLLARDAQPAVLSPPAPSPARSVPRNPTRGSSR